MSELSATPEPVVLPEVIEELVRGRTWLLTVAFCVYFLAAVTLVVGIIAIVREGTPAGFGAAPASSAVLVTILTAVVYTLPAVMLHRFASSISALKMNPSKKNLLSCLQHSTRFWRLIAIMLVIPIVLVLFALPNSF
jgi:hypothetical protein